MPGCKGTVLTLLDPDYQKRAEAEVENQLLLIFEVRDCARV